jgi:hypothetical protein
MREESRTKLIISVLVVIVVILLGVIAYFLWAQPAYQNFINQKQIEAYTAGQSNIVNGMIVQLQQAGYVQINLGNNQTLYMAPFNPQQAAQQQSALAGTPTA